MINVLRDFAKFCLLSPLVFHVYSCYCSCTQQLLYTFQFCFKFFLTKTFLFLIFFYKDTVCLSIKNFDIHNLLLRQLFSHIVLNFHSADRGGSVKSILNKGFFLHNNEIIAPAELPVYIRFTVHG